MQKNSSCSLDSLDAIFECRSCLFMACSKHYFSHTKENPDHNMERINRDINNESRKILINYITNIKQKFSLYINQWIETYSEKKSHDYYIGLKRLNIGFSRMDRAINFLLKTKYISQKIILSPLEYFLIQPPNNEALQQYVKFDIQEELPKNFANFVYQEFSSNLFEFNYFKFEDKKYIIGWTYKDNYDYLNLTIIILNVLTEIIEISEYEIAYEIIQNLMKFNDLLLIGSDILAILRSLMLIIYAFINEKNFMLSKKEFINFENAFSEVDSRWVVIYFYKIFSALFISKDIKNLSNYYLKKAESICLKDKNQFQFFFVMLVKGYNRNQNYTALKSICKKFIKLFGNEDSIYLLAGYEGLMVAYFSLREKDKLEKLAEKIKNLEPPALGKSYYYMVMGELHNYIDDYDNAIKYLWKSIKLQNGKSRPFLVIINFNLMVAYRGKKDFAKAHRMIANAKAWIGVIPLSDPQFKIILTAIGMFYFVREWYQDALECFETVKNYCSEHTLSVVKIFIGSIYAQRRNYCKALQEFMEVNNTLSKDPKANLNDLFVVFVFIGDLYNDIKSKENANIFFNKAFQLINYSEIENLKLLYFIFDYFNSIYDFEKCRIVLAQAYKHLKNKTHLIYHQAKFLTVLADFYFSQNRIEEAKQCFLEEEKYLNVEENFSLSKMKSKTLSSIIKYAIVYIELLDFSFSNEKGKYSKVKRMLKYCEEAAEKSTCTSWYPKIITYSYLSLVYSKEKKWIKARRYILKASDLNKQNDERKNDIVMNEYIDQRLAGLDKMIESSNPNK